MNRTRKRILILVLLINTIIVNYIIHLLNDAESLQQNHNKKLPNGIRISIKLDQLKGPIYYEEYFRKAREKINLDINLDSMFTQYSDRFDLIEEKWNSEYKINYNRNPPKNYEKWLKFAMEKKCPLHPNYYFQIDKDLMPFREYLDKELKGITFENILNAYNLTINIGLLEIGNAFFNPINSSCNETNIKLAQLRELLTDDLLKILPDKKITIAYNYHDYPRILPADTKQVGKSNFNKKNSAFKYNKCLKYFYSRYKKNTGFFISNKDMRITKLLPLFSSCKTICHKDILIPGYHHIREATNNIIEDVIPWEKKLNTLIWRGATTGVGWRAITVKDDYENFQRMRLVKWAMSKSKSKSTLPVKIDVGFISVANVYNNTELRDEIKAKYEFKDALSYRDHYKSKYLMVIDGHSWVSRFQPFLFSESLILFSSYFVEWFSFLTRPWYHYIPVDLSLQDLENNLMLAHKNDDQSKLIAKRASKLAQKHLNFHAMKCYAGLLLLEYADLLI